jgi:DNA polymerase-3 subunit delta'
MMNDLLINQNNLAEIERFINRPGHALLITGGYGMNKYSIALGIAQRLMQKDSIEQLRSSGYFFEINSESKDIGIDQIRELRNIVKLKTTGTKQIRRVVVIRNSDTMTNEAQNSILKILEEPPIDTVILLTAKSSKNIKPTIISRCQVIRVQKTDLNSAINYFKPQEYEESKIEQAFLLSGGAPGMMAEILSNESSNLLELLDETKKLLSSTRFDKLILVDTYVKEKDLIGDRIFVLKKVSRAALTQAIKKNRTDLVKYWNNVLKETQKLENNIEKGGNLKLLITNLFVRL